MGWCVGRAWEHQTQGECPPACKLFLERQQALTKKTGVGRDGGERLPPWPDPQVHQVHLLPFKLPQTFYMSMASLLRSLFLTSSKFLHRFQLLGSFTPFQLFSSCQVPKSMPHFKFLLQQHPVYDTRWLVSVVYSCITTSCAHNYVSQQFELNSAGQF